MKRLSVIAAGLGWNLLERNGLARLAGLDFVPKPSVFPAVTCVAQATLRTGLSPSEHGMVANGWWSVDLRKPLFWEQSANLVKGPRVWDARRAAGGTVGLYFLQQSLGESADVIVSPAPIHKHGGGMMMSCYTKPTGMTGTLEKLVGTFPLWRYWGPLASPKVGRKCINWFEEMSNVHDTDEAYLYLPTLDYAAQKYGPDSSADRAALKEFRRQLERLATLCEHRGCELSVVGDYEITSVTAASVRPNVTLRRAGLFKTRSVGGMSYPDFFQSTAFAMCDHEVCLVYGEKKEAAASALLSTGDYEDRVVSASSAFSAFSASSASRASSDFRVITESLDPQDSITHRDPQSPQGPKHPNDPKDPNDPLILLAKKGGWCEYKWWTDERESPDFASHVDIHNKPGYDPTELFFFGRGMVKGTHGRACEVAFATSATLNANNVRVV